MKHAIGRASNRSPHPGFTLLEVMVTVAILSVMALLVSKFILQTSRLAANARMEEDAARIIEKIMTRFQTARFADVLGADMNRQDGFPDPTVLSSTQSWVSADQYRTDGLYVRWSSSPMEATLREIEKDVRKAGFSSFKAEIQFIRRDSTDSNANASKIDYINFQDRPWIGGFWVGTPDGIDAFDANIRFQDCNGDNDFYDSTCPGPEVPDTHMKLLNISIFKGHSALPSYARQGVLVSQEKLTGNPG